MVAGALLTSTKFINLSQCMKVLVSQNRSFTSKLNEQQLAIQELARNYTNQYLKPKASQLDREGIFPFNELICKRLTVDLPDIKHSHGLGCSAPAQKEPVYPGFGATKVTDEINVEPCCDIKETLSLLDDRTVSKVVV